MKQSSRVQKVLSNPKLVSKIVSYLRYDYMKTCRQVNKLFRYEITKLTRPKTRVCVNEENIDCMLYASTILGLSLHIRWSSLISVGLRTLLQKYARYIESLSWFVDSSGASKGQTTNCVWQLQTLGEINFPNVTELYLILTEYENGHAPNFGLITALLHKSCSLEKLRLEVFDTNLNFSRVLMEIKYACLQHLVSLHIGKGVQLSFDDFKLIKSLTPPIQSLILESPITLQNLEYYKILKGAWLQSLHTLELNSPPPSARLAFPRMCNLRRLSITSLALTSYNASLIDQFPSLEDLSFFLKPNYDWSTWIPQNMAPHKTIKSLTYSSRRDLSPEDRTCLMQLITKLPNLSSLNCPADDEFLQVICKTLPHLNTLSVHGNNCSDTGVTGISQRILSKILSTVADVRAINISSINKCRETRSIFDLTELENLTLMHTGISDLSVPFAISKMKKLQKLYITGISMVGILELLSSELSLRELGVPQPMEQMISFEDIVILQNSTPHMKIVAGWDAPYIQSCSFRNNRQS